MTTFGYEIIESPGKPIKAWTRGVFVEDKAKQQLQNLSQMPFVFDHIAAMPDVHFGIGATVGSVIATKGAIIPASVGVDIGCFRGDMGVLLLDGLQATFEDLEQRAEPFWVYSIDAEGKVAPGLAKCIKTRTNAELLSVTVSGGEEIVCTPDHEFMLNDGSYKQAKDLQFNESLMSLYRREHTHNHKVLAVQSLEDRSDVYCLQVERHHNFALAAGVFVHNCGMIAQRTSLKASDLPDNLHALRTAIEAAVPHGRSDNGGNNDIGAHRDDVVFDVPELYAHMEKLNSIVDKHPKIERAAARAIYHAGTLGTGNHFIEVSLDENQNVWVMLHSGSRGIGNRIGSHFIQLAKEDMKRWFINLPDADLAYLVQGSKNYNDYREAVAWAQGFARINRDIMMKQTMSALYAAVPKTFTVDEEAINCHHNYISEERHFGENVMVTRKGAVDASEGTMGIIPGSMGAKSFIVRGKGNRDSFHSCSHGAGRIMSRTEAKKRFTIEDHAKATEGIECRKDADVIDETPQAYKDIDAVMHAQSELVDIVHTLHQVVCVKG